jgi:hypothetical protein
MTNEVVPGPQHEVTVLGRKDLPVDIPASHCKGLECSTRTESSQEWKLAKSFV